MVSRNIVSRRAVLGGLAGGLAVASVAGCSGPIATFGAPDPDDAALRLTAASERNLIAAYEAAIVAIPTLASDLNPIAEQHRQHLAALGDVESPPSGSETFPAEDRTGTLKALRMMERAAAKERSTAAVAIAAPAFVEIVTRIGASEAGHAAYLTTVAK